MFLSGVMSLTGRALTTCPKDNTQAETPVAFVRAGCVSLVLALQAVIAKAQSANLELE